MARILDGLVSEIRLTCSKIKFKDFFDCSLIEDVFHIEVDDLHREMKKYSLKMKSSEDLSYFLSETVRACTIEELREKLNHLKVWNVATKSSTRNWKTYSLLDALDENSRHITDAVKLRRELVRSFRIRSLDAVINVVNHQNMLWCAITGKKLTRRKSMIMEPTVYFCVSPGNPYLFTTPGAFPTVKLQRVANAFMYQRIKNCHLTGRDVTSLLKMVQARAETNASIGNITLSPDTIEVGHRHTDFTQGKKIKHYAKKCFDKSMALQTFAVESTCNWRGTDILPEMDGVQFNTTLEIQSSDVSETLKYYASIGVIKPPFPSYIKNILCSGKNYVKLRTKSNS